MSSFKVEINRLTSVAADFEGIKNNILQAREELEQAEHGMRDKIHSMIVLHLCGLYIDLDKEAEYSCLMQNKLLEAAEQYRAQENKALDNLDSAAAESENRAEYKETAADASNMTYGEYLQYRYENAADENTKAIYEKYIKNIRIKADDYDGTAYYDSFWNHIKYSEDADSENERGVGCTYYHEVGHLIDDQSDWFGFTSTDGSYHFYDALKNDVDVHLSRIMKENGYTDIQDAYDRLSDWLMVDANMKNGVSDIVNGLTDGNACGRWGHADNYYSESSISKEAFAHFFEAGMACDSIKLEYIKEMFPSAYEEYQRMLRDELG